MTSNIQTEKVLKITGSDNVTFLDSIISNNIEVDSIKQDRFYLKAIQLVGFI